MKRIIFLLSSLFLVITIYAQEYVPTHEDLKAFMKTKTLVVMDENPLKEYNFYIKDVVEKNWKITDYEFVTNKEFEAKRRDPNYSFLIATKVIFLKDKTRAEYDFLHLLLGKDTKYIRDMPDICAVPLAYKNVYEESYVYKLGTIARFIQNHVKLINNDPSLISSNIFKHYNKHMGDVKTKKLLLIQDEMADNINTIKKIKKIYPYDVELVEREVIQKAIENNDPNVVFLHKVGPEGTRLKARCYKIIIGAQDGQFYYFDYHWINDKNPDGLLASDLKKMASKKIKNK